MRLDFNNKNTRGVCVSGKMWVTKLRIQPPWWKEVLSKPQVLFRAKWGKRTRENRLPAAMQLCRFQGQVCFGLKRCQCGVIYSRNLAAALLNALCRVSGNLNPFSAVRIFGILGKACGLFSEWYLKCIKQIMPGCKGKPLSIKMCLKKKKRGCEFEKEKGGGMWMGLEGGRGRGDMK